MRIPFFFLFDILTKMHAYIFRELHNIKFKYESILWLLSTFEPKNILKVLSLVTTLLLQI